MQLSVAPPAHDRNHRTISGLQPGSMTGQTWICTMVRPSSFFEMLPDGNSPELACGKRGGIMA
jgi:hypothetical protein